MKRTFTTQLLAAIPAVAAMKNSFVQLNKKLVLLLLMLTTGLVAHATIQAGIQMQGLTRTVNNVTMCTFAIQSEWGGDQIPSQTGSSYTFSNANMIHGTADVILNGTLNFQEGTAFADVITSGSFTVTIESSSLWFYGATVQTKSGTDVSGCSASVSSDKHTLTVTIPSGKTFGLIIVDYVSNPPMTNSNTTVTVPAGDYWVSNSSHKPKPEPTVVYGQTTLVKDTDYTLSWSNNSSAGTGTVTVTGKGNYAGSATGTFSIRWARYYVHFDKNHDDATGTMSDQLFTYKTAQALTANTFSRIGYSFDGWCTTSNGEVTYTDGQSVSNLTAEDGQTITLYAKWTLITYNITYDLDGGSVATANPTSYNVTTNTFTLNNPTKTGYTFAGWTGTDLTEATQTVTIAQGSIGDRSYTANWTPITYNITYNLNGGSVATANPTTYTIETPTFTLNNPTRTGYTFAGWTGTDLTEATQTVTIVQGSMGDRSYTANWAVIPWTGDGSSGIPYLIIYPSQLDLLAKMVNGTDGYTANDFQGKHFKLGNDITYSTTGLGENESNYTAIGDGNSKYFQGTFDGDGKTISGIRIYTTDNSQGLFGYVYCGTVKNVILANSIIAGGDQVGGIVGNNSGAIVTNCIVESSVTINAGKSVAFHHGGIVGRNTGTVSGCISAATVSNNGYSNCNCYGGIVGYSTSTVMNCLYTGTTVTANSYYGSVVGRSDYTLTNNYYTAIELGGVGGNGNATVSADTDGARRARTITLGENVVLVGDETEAYNLSGLTAIGTGNYALRHGSTIYSGTTQNITLNYTGTIPEGYRLAYYSVNNEPVEGNTFEMPAADVVVEAVLLERYYTYNSTTGELALIFGEFNKDNKWGDDVTASAVTSVTATDEVSFTGSCSELFSGFLNCTSMDLGDVNTVNLTSTARMFNLCQSLTTLSGISGWNTSNVTDMSSMFFGCESLQSPDLSGWNTGSVTNMNSMFYSCQSIETLDLSGWDTGNVTDMTEMFQECFKLTTIYVGEGWSTESVTDYLYMFEGCVLLHGGIGTTYNPQHINGDYACYDKGQDQPGYLTGVFMLTLPEDVTTTTAATLTHNGVNYYKGGHDVTLAYNGTPPTGYRFYHFTVNGDPIDGDTFAMPFANSEIGYEYQVRYSFDSTTGVLSLNWGEFNKDNNWGSDVSASAVTSVTATSDVSFTGYCYELFKDFTNCESVDLSKVNTSNVTHMTTMFENCTNLTTLNLSGWDLSNVISMSSMFSGCSSLETIDLSSWDVSNVTYMSSMFENCTNLTTLNLSGWDLSNVNNMSSMFSGCSSLEAIDLSSWDVSNVTDMSFMFENCLNLTTLDLSSWDVSNVTETFSMFSGCTSLTSLDLSGWDLSNVTYMTYMFRNCSNLTTLNLSGWNTASVKDMTEMFYGCTGLETLNLSGWNTASVQSMISMFRGCIALTSLDLSSWDTGSVILMTSMFEGCSSLTSLILSGWDTGSVTDMNNMFNGCMSLESLDLSGWNMRGGVHLNYMFFDCTGLTTLDLSGWDIADFVGIEMKYMFSGCTSLTTIYVGEGWSTENVEESENMFSGCTSLVGGMGTTYDANHTDAEYARYDMGPNSDQPGYLTGVFALNLANDITASPEATLTHGDLNLYASGTTITLTYSGEVPEGYAPLYSVNGNAIWGNTFEMPFEDATVTVEVGLARYTFNSTTGELALIWGEFNKDNKWGDDVPIAEVTNVTATDEVSFTGDCTWLFRNFTGCTSMDLSKVNTDSVTNMASMFADCTSLDTLNLSGWNTANVTNMAAVFAGNLSLTTIKGLSDFNTGNVTSMTSMFAQCRSLAALDLRGWDVSNVTTITTMFQNCTSLTTLDLSEWDVSNVTNTVVMFDGCSGLETLDLSGWNLAKIQSMSVMFQNCSSLTTLDVSNWTIGSANLSALFLNCTGLTTLDLSTWNTSDVTDMGSMFGSCTNLTTIYVGEGWSAENVASAGNGMFSGCTNLVGGMGTTYDAGHTDGEYARMDRGDDEPGYLTGVFALTLPEDVTATPVATLTHGDVNLYAVGTTVTLSYTGEVPEGYKPVYLVNGNAIEGDSFEMPATDVVVEAVLLERHYTFNSTTGELALIFGEFNKDNKWGDDVTPSAVTSVTATDEVSFTGDCYHLFTNFTSCTSMDLGNVNTENVTSMFSMFSYCSSLTTLDLSGWNTANVTEMMNMFFRSSNLQSLNLSGWNTASVTDMNAMFQECSSLQSLDLSGWNTASVTDMNQMFYGCSSLTTLDLSTWNTSDVNDMTAMFSGCSSLTTIYVGSGWSTENVTDSYSMFYGCTNLVGGMGTRYSANHTDAEYARIDSGGWDHPGYFTGLFILTLADDITASPAAAVTHGDVNFYTPGTSITLTYSGVVPEGYAPIYSMNGNPFGGNSFDMPYEDITVTVDVQPARYTYDSEHSELVLLRGEFNDDFNWGDDVPANEVTSVTATDEVSFTGDCTMLFYGFTNCTSMDLSSVNTDEMTVAYGVFAQCYSLETLDLTGWNTSNVTNMGGMFYDCTSLTSIEGLSDFNTSNVTNIEYMFYDCQSLETLDLSNWNTSNVEDMEEMFAYCESLETLDLSGWNTSNVESMYEMFYSCTNLTSIEGLSIFNTSNVTDMSLMFEECSSLETLDLTGWNTSNVEYMYDMFLSCTNLTSIEGLSDFNTSNVTDMSWMFGECSSLETLNLSNWNTANVYEMYDMFNGCSNLTTIYVGNGWSTDNVEDSENMFAGCTNLVGGMGTEYDENHVNAEYAHIDGGTDNPGYFSEVPLDPVEYIDADGNTQTCTDYIVLEGGDYAVYGGYGVEAWYVVDHNVTYNDGVTFYGDVNLILVDGATLNLVNESEDDPSMYCYNTLTVYVQSGGTGAIVSNNVKLLSTEAIIHGGHFTLSSNSYLNAYNMTINGGQISAETNEGALYASQLTINGGTVAATVTGYYDAICADYVVINGGVITTTNQHGGNGICGYNDVTINGGIVTANSSYNYGIYTEGTLTLGWTNESDRITASSYYGEVTVTSGQAFSDETGHYYLNTLTDSQIEAIAGQTLSPFNDFGATFTITYMTNGGTLPDNYPVTYTFAETITLPIPVKEDNTFAGWYDNTTFEGDPVTEIEAGTALGNKTFYACWKPEYIDVTYLDADGQTQTAHAKVLYGIETELPGGVYTIVDDVYLDKLSFTGNTTIILPDYKYLFVEGMGKGSNDDEYSLFVNGNLTIYGQEYGTGLLGSYNVQISGDVAIYGGSYDIGYLSANNGSGTITLSWTALGSSIRVDVYLGDVVLAKDFMANDFEGGSTIIPAGQVSDNNSINAKYLTPYAETIDVSYIDENGATHTVNAHVLYGGETNLDGGYYTVIGDVIVDHTLSFEGNTTLIIPDDSYWYSIGVNNEWGDDEPIEGNGIAVEGDLAIYGQTRREGNIVIEASEAAIYATGNVTVSNVYFDTYTSNYGILSGGNILIAGGRFGAQSTLIANDGNGTITLGYLTEDDIIVCDGYEGIVVVREGQTLEDYWYHQTFSGALTAEEIAYIGGKVLVPYIIPVTLTVEGYGDGDGGWYLIASPLMGNTDVENVDGLISAIPEHYDLYRFNQAADMEWENWKQEGFSLESGRGYLYANKEGTTLTFTGVPAPSSTYEVTLAKTEGAELAGWNLIGNPFNANATVDKDFYMMNPETRDEIIAATNSSVAAMEGIFVIAAEDGETATFNATTSSKGRGQTHEPEQIVIELSTLNSQLSTSTIDRAIVRFGEGQQLPKFQLRESSTKVYIPQDGEDYAIVSVGKVDELPVNFKANKNGEYTLTVSETLNSQLSALSLLDNLTGARIDLLATPSYTFNALTTDYASRFKLVFATGDADNSEDFAFISNGNIIINGEGTLQVIDALGRILLTQKNTTANCKLSTANYKPGVYVLRLINGEDVKTQKIVIK